MSERTREGARRRVSLGVCCSGKVSSGKLCERERREVYGCLESLLASEVSERVAFSTSVCSRGGNGVFNEGWVY